MDPYNFNQSSARMISLNTSHYVGKNPRQAAPVQELRRAEHRHRTGPRLDGVPLDGRTDAQECATHHTRRERQLLGERPPQQNEVLQCLHGGHAVVVHRRVRGPECGAHCQGRWRDSRQRWAKYIKYISQYRTKN